MCEAFGELVQGNPFLPARIEAERQALGARFVEERATWSWSDDFEQGRPNIEALCRVGEALAARLRERLLTGVATSDAEVRRYVDLGCYVLYYRVQGALHDLVYKEAPEDEGDARLRVPAGLWHQFEQGYRHLFHPRTDLSLCPHAPEHLLALCFQTRRAFVAVFNGLVGGSDASAQLRAQVWQSIFTHDRRRYAGGLYGRMQDLPTLITGESGTGKEVVAGSIARAQYRAFDAKSRSFDPPGAFAAMNLSALPQTLIESELFGHKRGSFTGAGADRRGWLELVGPAGCVFLDEVGDVRGEVQVKLLRVLQDRAFSRVGESRVRRFEGKILAATNRDLAAEMEAGRFRPDLYYRLSGDLLRTPTLREQVEGCPEELRRIVGFLARRVVGDDPATREALIEEAMQCITTQVGLDYAWPGNFRELEQCLRNVLVRRCYTPIRPRTNGGGETSSLAADVVAGRLSVEALVTRYTAHVYRQVGTYEGAARRLGLDRRTVKAKVEADASGR